MQSTGRVLIGGGTGFVGNQIASSLEKRGYEVIIISRKPEQLKKTWKSNPLLFSSKSDNLENRKLISWSQIKSDGLPFGTVGVVNTAGHNVLDPLKRWGDSLKQELYNSRINTNRILAEAVNEASTPPLAFVSMSGVGYYPPSTEGEKYDENSNGGKHDWLAKLAKDWEEAAQINDSNTRCIKLRSGVVLGRHGGLVQQTILPFFLGLGGRMGPGDQIMPWIHVKDLADLAVHCLFSPSCNGVYNAVSPHLVTNNQFVKAYAKTLRRPAVFPIPSQVFNLIFGKERASMITQSQAVLPTRTLESGFQFQFPSIEEACDEFAHLMYVDPESVET